MGDCLSVPKSLSEHKPCTAPPTNTNTASGHAPHSTSTTIARHAAPSTTTTTTTHATTSSTEPCTNAITISNDLSPTAAAPPPPPQSILLAATDALPLSPPLSPHLPPQTLFSIMSEGAAPNTPGRNSKLVTFADLVPIEGSGRSSLSDHSRLLRSPPSSSAPNHYPLSPQMKKFLQDAEHFSLSSHCEGNASMRFALKKFDP